jgi:hypothetical protein
MKILLGVGVLLLLLGGLSLFVPIPRSERQGFKMGGVSLGVETHHDERVSPIVSTLMILGGVAMIIAGRAKR